MEEAQEIPMDAVASFKGGKYIPIAGKQDHVSVHKHPVNLLVYSNRYGYVFYATQNEGLAIVSASYIDRESRHLSKSSEDDDDEDANVNPQNQPIGFNTILRRPYIRAGPTNKAPSLIPYWIALNADDTILAIVLLQVETSAWFLILYDVVKLIQSENCSPLCPPMRLTKEEAGETICHLTWNPAIPTRFAYINGHKVVTLMEFNPTAKTLAVLGKSDATPNNSSICWSSKGKQLVVVTRDGTLRQYDESMKLKTEYASPFNGLNFPPCVSVLWISTYQFLLGFSKTNTDDNSYCHVLLTYDKAHNLKQKIFPDLFYDVSPDSNPANAQFYYARLNESKTVITGLSQSLKINVFGSNELNQDTLDTWTFADHCRASVKGLTNVSQEPVVISGMAIGLNSTLTIAEGNQKLPPCPILFMSNNEGVLQVYYFIHKTLPSAYWQPELIKALQPVSQPAPPPPPVTSSPAGGFSFANSALTNPSILFQTKENSNSQPFNFSQSTSASSSAKGLPFAGFNAPQGTPSMSSQPKEIGNNQPFTFAQSTPASSSAEGFSFTNFNPAQTKENGNSQPLAFTQPPPVTIAASNSASSFSAPAPTRSAAAAAPPPQNNVAPPVSAPISNRPISTPAPAPTTAERKVASRVDNAKFLQQVDQFQKRLNSVLKPLPQVFDQSNDVQRSIEQLTTSLNAMSTTIQKSMESIKTMTSEHIESMTRIETTRHQIQLSQQEKLHIILKDRELDPWTQARLDSIKAKIDRLKHSLNVLLQLTRTTIHDKSLTKNDDDSEDTDNEDFLPELEISLNTEETVQQRLRKRLQALSLKVTETDKDLNMICAKLKPLSLDSNGRTSQISDTTFVKKPSSKESSRSSDESILNYLRTHHSKPVEVKVPQTAAIRLSSISEQKKPSASETTLSSNSAIQSARSASTPSVPPPSESVQNMMRYVRTSIDLFSGTASPEQLREFSNIAATSPLSSAARSATVGLNRTPTIPKSNSLPKAATTTPIVPTTTATATKSSNLPFNSSASFQTPSRPVFSTVPTISLTPATPSSQSSAQDASIKVPQTRPNVAGGTDLSQSTSVASSSDNAIRTLLQHPSSSPATSLTQSTPSNVAAPDVRSALLGMSTPNASAASVQAAPFATPTTTTASGSVLPALSTPFGGSSPVSLASTITTSVQSTSPTTKTVLSTGQTSFGSKPIIGNVGAGFSVISPASTLAFGNSSTISATAPVFGSNATAASSTPTPFGSVFSPTTATGPLISSTGPFAMAPTSTSGAFGSGFGGSTTTAISSAASASPFASPPASTSSPFGAGFGDMSISTTAPSGVFGGAAPITSTAASGIFGGVPVTNTIAPSGLFGGTSAASSGIFGGAPVTSTAAPNGGGFGTGFGSSTTTGSGFGASPSFASSGPVTSPFGGGFVTASSTPSGSVFGSTPATTASSTTSSSGFGAFSFKSAVPAASTTTSAAGAPLFGSAASGGSPFGSGFSVFAGSQPATAAPAGGFSFGGFGGSAAPASNTPSVFGGAPALAAAQPGSPFGVAAFGAPPAQTLPSAFGAASAPFGGGAAPAGSSPSFTTYRK